MFGLFGLLGIGQTGEKERDLSSFLVDVAPFLDCCRSDAGFGFAMKASYGWQKECLPLGLDVPSFWACPFFKQPKNSQNFSTCAIEIRRQCQKSGKIDTR